MQHAIFACRNKLKKTASGPDLNNCNLSCGPRRVRSVALATFGLVGMHGIAGYLAKSYVKIKLRLFHLICYGRGGLKKAWKGGWSPVTVFGSFYSRPPVPPHLFPYITLYKNPEIWTLSPAGIFQIPAPITVFALLCDWLNASRLSKLNAKMK